MKTETDIQNTESKLSVKAVGYALAGFFFMALVGVFIKLEEKGSASIEWIVFMQYFTCLLIMTALAAKNKFRDLKTSNFKYLFIRSFAGVLAFSCYVISVTKIPLVNATLLNNTAPVFIPLITLIWLKNKIDEKIWWGISVGLVGIIFIIKPSEEMLFKTGDLYGLAAGILLAIAYVALKILTKTESNVAIIFYYSLIATILSFPFAISGWSNPPLINWIYAVLCGVCFILSLYLIQHAYKYADAVKLSPFNYSVIVFSGILDWIIFDHVPGWSAITGIALVTIGGILAILLHEKDNKDLKHHWH